MIYAINNTNIGMTSGANHILTSGGQNKWNMRHFGKRGGKKRKLFGQPVQHSPSLMGNSPANLIGLIHVLAHANILAGGSMTSDRTGGEDRTTDVDNGRHVGKMHVQIDFTVGAASSGYYEIAAIKYERSTTVPAIGVDPVPSSADISGDGLQRAVRSLSPGYIIYWDTVAITPGTNRTKKILLNWNKYGKATVRDGDYYTLIVFNRSNDNNTIYDIQTRYRTYSVT